MPLTIQQIQNNITNGGDIREIINQLADYIEANPGVDGGEDDYKVYTIGLLQSGISAPTAQEFKNTFTGGTTLSKTGVGNYRINNNGGMFSDSDKIYIAPFSNFGESATIFLPISNSSAIVGYYTIYRANSTSLAIESFNVSWQHADFSTLFSGNSTILWLPEIRVYP